MKRTDFKPGALLNPLPVIMAAVGENDGEANIITIAWTGIINSNPPMTYISVRPERYSYELLKETGDFTINLVTCDLAKAADYCGVRSGRDVDKWAQCGLERKKSLKISSPGIKESPLILECRIREIKEYPSHHMFVAEILNVSVADDIIDDKGRICLEKAGLVSYCHGEYLAVSRRSLGRFGFAVMKPKTRKRLNREKGKKHKSGKSSVKR